MGVQHGGPGQLAYQVPNREKAHMRSRHHGGSAMSHPNEDRNRELDISRTSKRSTMGVSEFDTLISGERKHDLYSSQGTCCVSYSLHQQKYPVIWLPNWRYGMDG